MESVNPMIQKTAQDLCQRDYQRKISVYEADELGVWTEPETIHNIHINEQWITVTVISGSQYSLAPEHPIRMTGGDEK